MYPAAPVYYSPYTGVPRIYGRLALEDHAVVIELPLPMRTSRRYGSARLTLFEPA